MATRTEKAGNALGIMGIIAIPIILGIILLKNKNPWSVKGGYYESNIASNRSRSWLT